MVIAKIEEIINNMVRQYRYWEIVLLFLCLGGGIGLFIPSLHGLTTICIILSMFFIPGMVIMNAGSAAHPRIHPIIRGSGAILISIVVLIAYLLICEFLYIPMTKPGVYPAEPGNIFQIGIIIYTSVFCILSVILKQSIPSPTLHENRGVDIRFWGLAVVLILLGALMYSAYQALPAKQTPNTTELSFESHNSDTHIIISNHEKSSEAYILEIQHEPGPSERIPLWIKDGGTVTYTFTNLSSSLPPDTMYQLTVRLYQYQDPIKPYREIWMTSNS